MVIYPYGMLWVNPSSRLKTWATSLSLKLWPFQDTNLIQPADSGTGPFVHRVSMDFLWRFSMFFPTDFSHISKGKTPRSTPNPGLEARDGGCAPILGAAHHDCLGAVAARSSDHPTNRWLSRTKSPKIVDFSEMITMVE